MNKAKKDQKIIQIDTSTTANNKKRTRAQISNDQATKDVVDAKGKKQRKVDQPSTDNKQIDLKPKIDKQNLAEKDKVAVSDQKKNGRAKSKDNAVKAAKKTKEEEKKSKGQEKKQDQAAVKKSTRSRTANKEEKKEENKQLNKKKKMEDVEMKDETGESQDQQSNPYPNLCKLFQPKPFTDHSANKCSKLTKYVEVTIYELYQKVKQEEKDNHRKVGEEETCPICMCELYDDLEKMDLKKLMEMHEQQMNQQMPIDVVIMNKCTDHCFHKQCLEMQMGNLECIRCAVCSQIYGIMTGNQPPGKMMWRLQPPGAYECDGYKGISVWELRYDFADGKLPNGTHYRGTRRHAYIPDTQEGREVLVLLIKAFQRKLTYIVGTSVTTGQTNVVVWNGIHHKTNTHGGSSSFGYPDPTYFNRVKLELADRGVFLDSPQEVLGLSKTGDIFVK